MFGYGYEDESGEDVSAFIDMIDGGGAGRSGPEFEGMGILSLLANMLFSPYGSADRDGGTGMMASDVVRPQARPRTGVPDPEDIETTILDAIIRAEQSGGVLPTADYEPLVPGRPAPRRSQPMSGVLPTADNEPLRYEPPAVTADYFATPPAGTAANYGPPGSSFQYPDLPTQADLDSEYAQSVRDRGRAALRRQSQEVSGVLPTAGNEPMRYEPPRATAEYFATPSMTERDISVLERAERMGSAPPALLSLFRGIPVGAPLTARESMILRALDQSAR